MIAAKDHKGRSILAAAVESGNKDVLAAVFSAIDGRLNEEV